MPTYEDAYLAGVFDGEGCITFLKTGCRRPSFILSLTIHMSYKPVLEKFQDRFGGRIDKVRKLFQHRKQMWEWRIRGMEPAVGVLSALVPYLIEKKAQAELAMEIISWQKSIPWGGKTKQEYLDKCSVYDFRLRQLKRVEF